MYANQDREAKYIKKVFNDKFIARASKTLMNIITHPNKVYRLRDEFPDESVAFLNTGRICCYTHTSAAFNKRFILVSNWNGKITEMVMKGELLEEWLRWRGKLGNEKIKL